MEVPDSQQNNPENPQPQNIEIEKKEEHERQKFLAKSIFDKLPFSHPLLKFRTQFCQHEFGCIENIIRGFTKSFLLGYLIKSVISLIGALINLKKYSKK